MNPLFKNGVSAVVGVEARALCTAHQQLTTQENRNSGNIVHAIQLSVGSARIHASTPTTAAKKLVILNEALNRNDSLRREGSVRE